MTEVLFSELTEDISYIHDMDTPIVKQDLHDELRTALQEACKVKNSFLRGLPKEERRAYGQMFYTIIRARFGFDCSREYTLKELGDKFGLSGTRVRQIECRILRVLRHPKRARRLKEYVAGVENSCKLVEKWEGAV